MSEDSAKRDIEVEAETLWRAGLEVISKMLTLWSTYSDNDPSKKLKITAGLKLIEAICELSDSRPDAQSVREYLKQLDALSREVQRWEEEVQSGRNHVG